MHYCKYFCDHFYHNLVVKTYCRMKHISNWGPYLGSLEKPLTLRRSWVLTNPKAPSTSEMTLWYLSLLSLRLGSILCFYTAFLRKSSYFFSLMWAMVGHFSALLLLSVLCHCLQFGLESIWPGKSRHCAWGALPVHPAWGRGAASSLCRRVIGTSQTLPLALIGCSEQRTFANQFTATGWNHRHFYSADLYLILLSDHNDNFSIYNEKMVTDYSFNWGKCSLHCFGLDSCFPLIN